MLPDAPRCRVYASFVSPHASFCLIDLRLVHMKISHLVVLKGVGWTVGAFGVGQLLRLVTVVAIARLLAPELFGIMAIVNSLRTGVDLLSDVGITQNIIQNKNGDDPDFYNTAWTLQLIRGPVLWLLCSAAAVPLSPLTFIALQS